MKQYELTAGIFDRRRKLILTPEYLEFEKSDAVGQEFTRINKADVVDFKHGMDWIRWYKFTVGRQFTITFKDNKNKELKLTFKSYFSRSNHFNQLYADVVEDIWAYYQNDIVATYLDRYHTHEPLTLQGLTLTQSGIKIAQDIIPWKDVGIKEYYGYFALFHKSNPTLHATISYNEYETETLWSLVKTILEERT